MAKERPQRPCAGCGGSKPRGGGIRFCDACKPVRRHHDQFLACARCGGEKPRGVGLHYCVPCRAVVEEEKAQKARDRARAWHDSKTPEERRKKRRKYKSTAAARARANKARNAARKTRPRAPSTRTVKVSPVALDIAAAPAKQPQLLRYAVPVNVRAAWKKADKKSILKQKFPTRASLEAHDWSKYEA